MKQPNWQLSFRDFPLIPYYKRWIQGSQMTLEQQISLRLIHGYAVTNEELMVLNSSIEFYNALDKKLEKLDYNTLNQGDFEHFKNYILYAFNYQAIIANNIKIFSTYRTVLNESVLRENKRIRNIVDLKYPSLKIVKENKKYNRSNTPDTTVFYSSENIDTTLKELKPPANKLVTVGVWRPNIERSFVAYPISHSNVAFGINNSLNHANNAFESFALTSQQQLANWMAHYFKVLGREYTKKTEQHYEYFITSMFSERILNTIPNEQAKFRFDCIVYPSVGNDYQTCNLAIKPSVIDTDFHLEKAIEFEIEEANYNSKFVTNSDENVTIAKIKNLHTSRFVDNEGNIHW